MTTASDDRGSVTTTAWPVSGSVFTQAVTTVHCTAIDASSNLTTCEFTVTLVDTEAPMIATPIEVIVSADPGQCTASGVQPEYPIATDNCSVLTLVKDAPASFAKGRTKVTWTATDAAGNTAKAIQYVTVTDTQPPVLTCPTDVVVPCSIDLTVPVTYGVTAQDNCTAHPVVTYSIPEVTLYPIGTTAVTATATDDDGNTAVCSFNVTRAALGFRGFLAPIGGADTTGGSFAQPIRTFKLGSTIPVKFVATCSGASITTGVHRLQLIKFTEATTSGDPIDATPQDAATSGNQFRFADGQWHFNLDTKATGISKGIWQMLATLSDGSQHSAWIQLK